MDCRAPRPRLLSTWRSPQTSFAIFLPDRRHPWPATAHFTKPDLWDEALGQRIDAAGGRVLVFIHGYNNSPSQVADRAMLLKQRTHFNGPVVAFTWPSQGSATHYTWDEQNVAWTEKPFGELLNKIRDLRPDVHILLVSHSMGNRAAMHTVARLKASNPATAARIGQMILASPDVDRELFVDDLKGLLPGRRITVYTSFRDAALKGSWNIHGYARAGDPSCNYDFWRRRRGASSTPVAARTCYFAGNDGVPEGVELVDTSAVRGKALGHADFVESPVAAADLCRVIANRAGKSPDRQPVAGRPRIFFLTDGKAPPDQCGP